MATGQLGQADVEHRIHDTPEVYHPSAFARRLDAHGSKHFLHPAQLAPLLRHFHALYLHHIDRLPSLTPAPSPRGEGRSMPCGSFLCLQVFTSLHQLLIAVWSHSCVDALPTKAVGFPCAQVGIPAPGAFPRAIGTEQLLLDTRAAYLVERGLHQRTVVGCAEGGRFIPTAARPKHDLIFSFPQKGLHIVAHHERPPVQLRHGGGQHSIAHLHAIDIRFVIAQRIDTKYNPFAHIVDFKNLTQQRRTAFAWDGANVFSFLRTCHEGHQRKKQGKHPSHSFDCFHFDTLLQCSL